MESVLAELLAAECMHKLRQAVVNERLDAQAAQHFWVSAHGHLDLCGDPAGGVVAHILEWQRVVLDESPVALCGEVPEGRSCPPKSEVPLCQSCAQRAGWNTDYRVKMPVSQERTISDVA